MKIYLLPIFIFLHISCGAIIKCLDRCECDDVEEIIHCHKLGLKSLILPKSPMKNYKVLRATDNDLKYLPSEELLKGKFPQLEGVDVEGNTHFDCQSLPYYKKLTIFSDCNEDGEIVLKNINTTTSQTKNITSSDENCNFKCMISDKAQKLADYAKYYWEKFLDKLRQFNRENKTWNEIKGAFNNFRDALGSIF